MFIYHTINQCFNPTEAEIHPIAVTLNFFDADKCSTCDLHETLAAIVFAFNVFW